MNPAHIKSSENLSDHVSCMNERELKDKHKSHMNLQCRFFMPALKYSKNDYWSLHVIALVDMC